ncbi:MAG: DUF1570 domain-containing protein [Planctomycetota bacterium]
MKHRAALALAALWIGLVLAAATAAHAAGEEEAKDPFEEAFATCRNHVRRGKWQAAVEGYRKLLADFEGDVRPIQRVRIIEDELKLCRFRLQYAKREMKDLLGPSCEEYKSGGRVLLAYPGPVGPQWQDAGEDAWLLDLEFKNDFELNLVTTGLLTATRKGSLGRKDSVVPVGQLSFLFCFDPAEGSGYFAGLGVNFQNETHRWSNPGVLSRLDAGENTVLQQPTGIGDYRIHHIRLVRKRKKITLDTGRFSRMGKPIVWEVEDSKHREGRFLFLHVRPQSIRIKGALTKECVNDLRADSESQAFLRWLRRGWNRSANLPEWMLKELAERSRTFVALIPSGAAHEDAEELGRLVTEALFGDEEVIEELEKRSEHIHGVAKNYIACVLAVANGDYESVDGELTRLSEFAPALALRGVIRLIRGKAEEARADLAAAREKEPRCMLAWYGLVQMAIGEGDLAKARRLIDAAEKAGVRSRRLTELSGLVYRTIAGPLWTKSWEKKSGRFIVRTNHSEKTARRVAYALNTAVESYAKYFSRAKGMGPAPKSRVYVFATKAGYLRYAGEVRKDLEGSAGAYDPRTKELVLFVPDQNDGFVHTVRHEGFHQFIDATLPEIPTWFNEGCAEYFACGEKSRFGGRITPGAVRMRALFTLRRVYAADKKPTPLTTLFLMSHRKFMRLAALHYAQGWAVVHYLREGGDREMADVFDDYAKELRAGASAREAYDRVLAPVVKALEHRYQKYVKRLIAEHLGR